jgi:hypothetical protein
MTPCSDHRPGFPVSFVKSSASGGDGCVEVAIHPRHGVVVRDSKDPGGAVLSFTDREWVAFVEGVRNGEFDLDRKRG